MKKFVTVLAFACLVAVAAMPALAAQDLDDFLASLDAPQAFAERHGVFDPAAVRAEQKQLHAQLVAARVEAGAENPARIVVTPQEMRRAIRAQESPQHFKKLAGMTKAVGAHVSFAGVTPKTAAVPLAVGAVRGTRDGFVWTGSAVSEGAAGVRVHFTDFSLPAGSALYVYNQDGDVHGPYTGAGPNGTGDFWTHTISGGMAYLQVTGNAPEGSFTIADVGHVAQGPVAAPQAGTLCSFNAECVESAACTSSSAVADAEGGVAHIQFVSGPWIYICSGGLLADTDTATSVPLFLTANHCISSSSEASSMEAFFFFEATGCGGGCYNPDGIVPSTLGASILSTSSTSDYTLMQLAQAPPSGAVFLGWNATAVANSNGAHLYRISHPQGAPQAYSEHDVDTSKGTCSSWPRGNWIYSRDVLGATEGGSSGSPVVNAAGQVVGQLSGACGFNVNDSCDAASNATVDGALAAYYGNVSQWLDPGSGGGDDGGGGSCTAKGDACSSNSDCCSNKCRGPNNRKTCK
ncbi:MAG TPA: serine protease [Thermoanaerobaculia bacterium]|nr:serine protease [Thermoanaerobaculia bacterium]